MDLGYEVDGVLSLPTPESNVSGNTASRVIPYETTGDIPFFRLKSSYCVTEEDTLFLFGGFDEDDNLDSNIYILDLQSGEWSKKHHKVYREGHSCTYIGRNTVLIIGGEQNDEEDANSQFSTSQVLLYNILEDRFSEPENQEYPSGRSRHASCITPDKSMIFVSGGIYINDMNQPIEDLYCLDLTTLTWSGPIEFVARFDHFITYYENKIYAFGGLTKDMNHVSTISWIDLETNLIGEIKLKDVPRQMGGDSIYLSSINYNPSIVANVLIPLWNSHTDESEKPASIATFDIVNLRWNMVVIGDYPLRGKFWRQSFASGDRLYLLGSTTNTDNQLSEVIKFDISSLGIQRQVTSTKIGNNFIEDFSQMLYDDNFTDFEIFGTDVDTGKHSSPIRVHKVILLARWPHFRRVISSGMSESTSNKMFIPEPVSWLKGLVTYLYTNQLDPSITSSMEDFTGLLILSNLYEMNDLKSICLNKIYHSANIENLVFIWQRSLMANEPILTSNCCKHIYDNWGVIVRSQEFQQLDKHLILKLFEGMDETSKIVSHRQDDTQTNDAEDGIMVEEASSFTSLHTGLLTRLSSPKQARESDSDAGSVVGFPTFHFGI